MSHAPMGRMTNPTANTEAPFINCAVRSPDGKNTGAKYTEKAANTNQTYQSTKLPAESPRMRRTRAMAVLRAGSRLNGLHNDEGGSDVRVAPAARGLFRAAPA